MPNAYIVLTRTGSRFSKFLGFFTKAEYNHASICIYDDFKEFYSFGRRLIWLPVFAGFVTEHINCGMYKYFNETRCVVFSLQLDQNRYNELKCALEAFKKNPCNYHYNFLGLLGVFINKPLGNRNHYFCSQFVASVIQDCGIHNFGKSPSLVLPEDFCTIPGLQKVYEGRLSDLPHMEFNEKDCHLNKVLPV